MIGLIECEICTKMLRNVSEKLGGKFPSTALGYSLVRISRLDHAFSGIFELEASLLEGQQLQQKDKRKRKRETEKSHKTQCKWIERRVLMLQMPLSLVSHFLCVYGA